MPHLSNKGTYRLLEDSEELESTSRSKLNPRWSCQYWLSCVTAVSLLILLLVYSFLVVLVTLEIAKKARLHGARWMECESTANSSKCLIHPAD